jgi:hypothetical protein
MKSINFQTITDTEFIQLAKDLYDVWRNEVGVVAVRTITKSNGERYTASISIADTLELCGGLIQDWRGNDVTVSFRL